MPRPTVVLAPHLRRRQSDSLGKPPCTEGIFQEDKAGRLGPKSSPRYSPIRSHVESSTGTSPTRTSMSSSKQTCTEDVATDMLSRSAQARMSSPGQRCVQSPPMTRSPSRTLGEDTATGMTPAKMRAEPSLAQSCVSSPAQAFRRPRGSSAQRGLAEEAATGPMQGWGSMSVPMQACRPAAALPPRRAGPSQAFAEDTAAGVVQAWGSMSLPVPKPSTGQPIGSGPSQALAEDTTACIVQNIQAWGSLSPMQSCSTRGSGPSQAVGEDATNGPVQAWGSLLAPGSSTAQAARAAQNPLWSYRSVRTPSEDKTNGLPRTHVRMESSENRTRTRVESSPRSSPVPSPKSSPRSTPRLPRRASPMEIRMPSPVGLQTGLAGRAPSSSLKLRVATPGQTRPEDIIGKSLQRRQEVEGVSQPCAEDLRSQARQLRLCAKLSPSPSAMWCQDGEHICADDLRNSARQIRLCANNKSSPVRRQQDLEASLMCLANLGAPAPRASPVRHMDVCLARDDDRIISPMRNRQPEVCLPGEDARMQDKVSPVPRRDGESLPRSPPPQPQQAERSSSEDRSGHASHVLGQLRSAPEGLSVGPPTLGMSRSPSAHHQQREGSPAIDELRAEDKVARNRYGRPPPSASPVRLRAEACTYDDSWRRRPKTEESMSCTRLHDQSGTEDNRTLQQPPTPPKRARPEEFTTGQPSRSVRRVYQMLPLRSSSLGASSQPLAAIPRVRSSTRVQLRNLELLLPRLADFLCAGSIASMARMSSHAWQVVQTFWGRMLFARGFTQLSAVSLSLHEIIGLERWGGQYWDVWMRAGPKREYRCLLRHWQYGTTVLLSGTSNGWFEFQVRSRDRPQIFYSSGVCGKAGMFANLGEHSELELDISQMAPGSCPLLEIPCDAATWWRWKFLGNGCLTIHYGPPGAAKKRLVFTSAGFSAFMDSCESEPAIVVERGNIVYKERHGEDQHQDNLAEAFAQTLAASVPG